MTHFENEGVFEQGRSRPNDAELTLKSLIDIFLEDYELRQFTTLNTARGRVAHLVSVIGNDRPAGEITAPVIRRYQMSRRREGASAATVNRETSALSRMFRLAFELGWISTRPMLPARLRENGPRQGFFEHADYLAVRSHLPAPYQDVLDFAYYSGWRKREILGLRWEEVDTSANVIRFHRNDQRRALVGCFRSPNR